MPQAIRPNRSLLLGAALALLTALPIPLRADDSSSPANIALLELVMFERDGCSYCLRWHEEIGPAYPNTAEGAAAPLRRIDIAEPLPGEITLTGRPPVFTPTFVLLREGTEVARIEGYAGDEFFWVLLDGMLDRAGWTGPPGGP